MMRMFRFCLTALLIVHFTGCAQVPRESVELSSTVGRDLVELKRSHLALIDLYFDEKLANVDRFVDTEFKPYQIRETLKMFKPEISEASQYLLNDSSSDEEQQNGLDIFSVYLEEVNNNVESFRDELQRPLIEQRQQLITDVSSAYDNAHDANAIVVAHLASIVKVHDAQDELLASMKMDDLRSRIGITLNNTSQQIEDITGKAGKLDNKLDKLDKLIKRGK